MKIFIQYKALESIFNIINHLTASKFVSEDWKVVNFFVQDGSLMALGTDTTLHYLTKVEADFDTEGEQNPFITLKIKDMLDIIGKFASLQRTEVKRILIEATDRTVVMSIEEGPKEEKGTTQSKYAQLYENQISKFRMVREQTKDIVIREIPNLVMPEGAETVDSKDMQLYLRYMYPALCKPPRVVPDLNFNEEYVYSIINYYGILMPNKLPTHLFEGFKLKLSTVGFLNMLLTGEEHKTFQIHRFVDSLKTAYTDDNNQAIVQKNTTLTIKIGDGIIRVKALDLDKIDLQPYKGYSANYISVDKLYLLDVLKRIEGVELIFIEVNITDDTTVPVAGKVKGEMIIKTQRTKQSVPIMTASGTGSYKFSLSPAILAMMIFSHITKDLEGNSTKTDDLFMHFSNRDNSRLDVTCRDASLEWQVKYPNCMSNEAPALDF